MAKSVAKMRGLKLIKHNASKVDLPDDPSFPFKLEVSLSLPEFMNIAFIGLFGGTEELVIRGETMEALNRFIDSQSMRTHPRLRKLTITGPNGVIEEKTR